MKKLLLFIPALLFTLLGNTQGIEFEHGTWKEVLAKAQQTNKPVFVDVYTTWCGPCKQMSSTIFPLAEVGKVYNANFVCYQIDAEKGEGIEFAKKYNVKAYPTYLFIKADGNLFFTSLGSMPAEKFIAVSTSAISEMNDPKPIAVWDKEYMDKKNDPKFLLDYINKRSRLGVNNAQLFDEYLKAIPVEERASKVVIDFYMKEGRYIKVNSFAYTNLQENRSKLFTQVFGYVNTLLNAGIMNTLNEASSTKNEQLLATAIKAYDQLPKGAAIQKKDELYMQYYKQSGETDKYLSYATNFGNNYLMKKSLDTLALQDKWVLQMIDNQIKTGAYAKMDTARIAELRSVAGTMERSKVCTVLNDIAWNVFEKVTDKSMLQTALGWSKRSLEILPNTAAYLDTYANLFYKLGQKQEAIQNEKEALRYADPTDIEGYKGMEETLRKMNAGEKTWK